MSKPFEVDYDEWYFFDLRYGIPLFDKKLNESILNIFMEKKLGSYENLNKMQQTNKKLSLDLLEFIQQYQNINIFDKNFFEIPNYKEDYLLSSLVNKNKKHFQPGILIRPTQCVLFDSNEISIFEAT